MAGITLWKRSTSSAPPGTPVRKAASWELIVELANKKMAAEPGLTFNEAIVAVVREQPDLYNAYTAEQRGLAVKASTTTEKGHHQMSAYEQIETLAKGKIQKGVHSDFGQALQAVCRERPDLYAKYSHEQTFIPQGATVATGGAAVERLQGMADELVRKGQATPDTALSTVLATPAGQALRQAYYRDHPHLLRG